MASEPLRLSLVVCGRVQGVGFRASVYDEAQSLGLTGWVRNLPSGEVEMVMEGKRENLGLVLSWAHIGPPGARVTDVREDWSPANGEFHEFRIRS